MVGQASAMDLPLHTNPGSWLNAVENFFSRLTRQRIRRGVFRSIVDLQAAINAILTNTMLTRSPSCGPNQPLSSSTNSPVCLHLLCESEH